MGAIVEPLTYRAASGEVIREANQHVDSRIADLGGERTGHAPQQWRSDAAIDLLSSPRSHAGGTVPSLLQ